VHWIELASVIRTGRTGFNECGALAGFDVKKSVGVGVYEMLKVLSGRAKPQIMTVRPGGVL